MSTPSEPSQAVVQLATHLDGALTHFPLTGREIRLGRAVDNDIVLGDFSVSRYHAVLRRERGRGEGGGAGGWVLYDLMSTNGVVVNGERVREYPLQQGDELEVGIFTLAVELSEQMESVLAEPEEEPVLLATPVEGEDELTRQQELSKVAVVRPLSQFTAEYGLAAQLDATHGEGPGDDEPTVRTIVPPSAAEQRAEAPPRDAAFAARAVGYLARLARVLIAAESVDAVLRKVMDIAFEALPVDRGFILLKDDDGTLRCRLAREGDEVEVLPQGPVPVSRTIMRTVIEDRVALLTYDAQSDARLMSGDSIRLHQIRSALCAPLWSGERIIGVLQVDSKNLAARLSQRDLDLLTTVSNYAAVAVERVRYEERALREKELRSRLERYHSPGVIEDVLARESAPDSSLGRLRKAEVSVLFADLVGFTSLSEQLAPEEVAGLLESFFTDAVEAIFEAGGTLDKFIGDCVMAFFGAPMAQPDHAQRAVSAARSILRAVDRHNRHRGSSGKPEMAARIAINSGPVVVGDIGSNRRVDYTVLGNTVNVAARLESSVARPGDVVLGSATRAVLGQEVVTEALGEFQLKGLSRPIDAFRLKL
ncbi:MAG: adenylate/guanylate cyclase domain-containing protein [Acidobacteriota bacterium]